MKTSDNINVTDARLRRALSREIDYSVMPGVNQKIKKAVNDSKFKIGEMVKFYPYLDKAMVKVDSKTIICKILHRFGGDITDFYTPMGDEDYCTVLKEPCIIPMATLECLILDVDDSSNEQILVGYLNSDDIVGLNPASQGNFKITTRGGSNQFWIKFGFDGLDLRLPDEVTTNVGEMDKDMTLVDYSNTFYTKSEIDSKIEEIMAKITEITEEDTNDTAGG